MTEPDLAQIANRHWAHAFAALVADLGGDLRRFGSIDAFLGNLPLPFANGCLVLEAAEPHDLEAAVAWVSSGRVPFQLRVDERFIGPLSGMISSLGLERDPDHLPAMVLSPIGDIPVPPPGITISVVDQSTYAEFLALLIASGIPAHWSEQIFPARLIGSDDGRYFLAALEGKYVAISVAVRTGESGGIYSVATLEEARRRGVGSAVTWAAVRQIRDWGCTAAVLQASELGYSVYRSMGFKEVVRYIRFTVPPTMVPGPGESSEPVTASEAGHEEQGEDGRNDQPRPAE